MDHNPLRRTIREFLSEWRPNTDTRGIRYVGKKACADCHPREAAQLTTPMALALEVAPDSRGHNTNDPRISCLACHNLHEKLQQEAAYTTPSVWPVT
jgi:hypothetical protein